MDKIIKCRMCGNFFRGHHNAMFCASCRKERARENSYVNWKKIQAKKREVTRTSQRAKQHTEAAEQDIGKLDIQLAEDNNMSYGKFSVWKVYHEQEYIEMLQAKGYAMKDSRLVRTQNETESVMDKF